MYGWLTNFDGAPNVGRGGLRLAVALLAATVAALAAAASAAAGTTAASTFSVAGTDPTTHSTGSSAGTIGTTGEGDTINWVLNYRNTTGSSATTSIADPIGANQTFVGGSLKTPPGLTPGWSTNGGTSFSSTEPAAGVNAIQAQGTSPESSTAAQSLFSAPAGAFAAGNSNGDGFESLFIGSKLYNLHHHRPAGGAATFLDCHIRATGAECPGYPATYASQTAGDPFGTGGDTLDTPYEPFAAVDRANGKIYFPAGVEHGTSIGIACADVITNTSCGYTKLADDAQTNDASASSAEVQIAGGAVIGTKFYVLASGAGAPVYCFDYSTGAACPNYPILSDPGLTAPSTAFQSAQSQVRAFDGRYVFGNEWDPSTGHRDITCIDTTTDTVCAGFPVKSYVTSASGFDIPLAPTLDAGGNVTGICGENEDTTLNNGGSFACFHLDGTSAGPAPWGQLVAGETVGDVSFGGPVEIIGSRLYLAYDNDSNGATTYACWDFSTNAKCAGFVQASTGHDVEVYTIRQDPDNPDCIWEVGNAGVFEVFSATFGGTSCNEGNAQVPITPASDYCDGAGGHVTGWNDLVLGGVTASDFNGLSVTITDANGDPVPGWTKRILTSSQVPIDISSIPYSGSTTTLHVSVAINWGAHTAKPATLSATFTGDPPQVCFQTKVGPSSCNVTQSITNSATAVTVGTDGTSDAPAGNSSGDATLLQAASPTTAKCRADLSVVKTAEGAFMSPGGQEIYTLVVQNHGPDQATSAKVSDNVPSGLTVVSLQPTQGSCATSGGAIRCSLGTIPNGGAAQILVTANVSSTAVVGSSVKNCADTSAFQADPVASNNSSCASTPVKLAPPGAVDLQVVKHVDHKVAKFGRTLRYRLDVKNNGPDTAPDAKVTDTSAAGLRVTSIKPSQGTCTKSVPFTCDLGALGPGRTATITIKAIPRQTGPEVNNVSTTPGCNSTACATDTDPANNVSAARTTVKPFITLVKSVKPHAVDAGGKVTYQLTVADPTPVPVKHVRVCDRLPAGIVFARSSPKAKLSSGEQCWTFATLGAHRSRTIRVAARAAGGASGNPTNHATATGDGVAPAHAGARVHVRPAPPRPTPVTG